MHPGPQWPPSSKPGNCQPQAIQPASSAMLVPPLHTSQRSRPLGALPTSFRRNREIAAAQGLTVSGDPVVSTNVQVQAALPVKDWFVSNDYPTNTRAVYEELEQENNKSITKEEALNAAFKEIDAVALPVHNPKNSVTPSANQRKLFLETAQAC
ncbi:MAG: hypothetical protein BYD32DRAFT_461699 [Podila humilis]|nr:MAG: hypothetical protein BYD32DRAFT_461699 [Podila humilis]